MSWSFRIPLVLSLAAIAAAEDTTPSTPSLADQFAELQRQNAALDQRLKTLEQRPPPASSSGNLHLIDLSLDVLGAVGTSTAQDAEIQNLQGGGHDPKRRGFTFQGAELSVGGAVDPYFAAEAHLVAIRDEPSGETSMEVEEAFVRSTSLPGDLELKTGLYLTEFGRFNPTHPHAWYFIDQPIIITRVFGGDGQRAPGARLLWSLPTDWLSDLIINVQDANGANSPSFISNDATGAVGGRAYVTHDTGSGADMFYSARWVNGIDVGDTMVKAGLSAATGANAAGTDTTTALYGADLAAKWHPAGGEHGWPFVVVETEFIRRDYQTDGQSLVSTDGGGTQTPTGVTAVSGTLHDQGVLAQVVWGFHPGWTAGLRYEHVTGSGDSVVEVANASGGTTQLLDRGQDPMRDDRTRITPLIGYAPSEFAHFKLQYDYDRADHLDRPVHSVWLGMEFLIGTHPAHTF